MTPVDSIKDVFQTPEEGRRSYRPKRCGNNNGDEDNSPKTLNDKNHQASSQKFRQYNEMANLVHCVQGTNIFVNDSYIKHFSN